MPLAFKRLVTPQDYHFVSSYYFKDPQDLDQLYVPQLRSIARVNGCLACNTGSKQVLLVIIKRHLLAHDWASGICLAGATLDDLEVGIPFSGQSNQQNDPNFGFGKGASMKA